jgi:hypothetical protein
MLPYLSKSLNDAKKAQIVPPDEASPKGIIQALVSRIHKLMK